ncbi:MAG TPA: ABC transporter permease [Gemmatimonadaceae bacterium]|jgi:predicted permease|nr:ABC transporter permease [Gemmatimonadaceae bacterium]
MRRVFRILSGRRHIIREVDDELAFHLQTRIERLMAGGLSYDQAHREAMRQFGDVDAVRASCVSLDEQRERSRSRRNMMAELQQDLVYAVRTLRRNAGFTAVIVGALAIGVGANTAIFTLIDAVMMRRLPVPHPEQLVVVGDPARIGGMSQGSVRLDLLSYPVYKDLRGDNHVFSDVLASGRSARLDVQVDGSRAELEHPRGRFVSSNYFSVLGVPALMGRTLDTHMDDVSGSSPVAVISYAYWTRRFKNERSAIGRTITIDGLKITIIGVTPPDFAGEIVGSSNDMWLPVSMQDALRPSQTILNDRSASWLLLLGRLRPGATLEQAQAEVPEVLKRHIVASSPPALSQQFVAGEQKYHVSDGSKGFSRVRDTFHAPLLTLMIGVALLLCIICANVANLLLARAVARGREMSVRLALGADRSRLVRQLLTESAVLAISSALVGMLVAWWGSRALLTLAADGGRIPLHLGVDLPVLGFTLAISIGAVALFGLMPALRASRVDLASTMRAGATSVAGSALGLRGQRAPLGMMLVAGQVALSIVLLVGATMLVRSLRNVQSTDVGLDRDHLVVVDVDVMSRGYTGPRIGPFANRLRDRLAAVPGVVAVSFSENGIFSGTESATSIELPGFQMRQPADSQIAYDQVGARYVKAIGAHLLAGRDLLPSDESGAPRVAVVNQALANFYFDGNAIGKYLHFNDSVAVQIVGVIADTRDHELAGTPARRVYFPFVHAADSLNLGWPGNLRLEVRTAGDPTALVQPIRKAVLSVDSTLPIDGIDPLATLMRDTISQERLLARLASAFGVLALLLAAVGLYGVMTYAITRRTGEIGLRVALGAQRGNVVRMILLDALRLVGLGVVVGLPLALASARLLRTQLHEVSIVDPASIAVAIVVLTASAFVAGLVPALRAARVSPIVALRAE